MKTQNTKTIFMIGLVSIVLTAGCGTVGSSRVFDDNGLPRDRYYVGGGFSLEYRAPKKGTAYVVEENSNRLIGTKSLEKDQRLNMDINPTQYAVLTRLKSIGVDPANMRLGLYFVPSQAAKQKEE